MGPIEKEFLVRDRDELFEALGKSRFRSRFRLGARERAYLQQKGLEAILVHAEQFIIERLAPAQPENDGKQTPMQNHPVFIAQHATGTCCRGCLAKWHRISKGKALTPDQIRYVVGVIEHWLKRQNVGEKSSEPKNKEACEKTLFS